MKTHRPPYQAGDLLFFSGRGLLAAGIKFGTLPWLGYSHVGLVVELAGRTLLVDATTLDNEPCLITAKTSGCRARAIPGRIMAYQEGGGQVYHFPLRHQLSDGVKRNLEYYARSQLGRDYDWLGAWRCRSTPIAWLFRLLFPNNRAALYCAESSADILDFAKVIECDNPADQSPNSLAALVAEQATHGPRLVL